MAIVAEAEAVGQRGRSVAGRSLPFPVGVAQLLLFLTRAVVANRSLRIEWEAVASIGSSGERSSTGVLAILFLVARSAGSWVASV